MFAVVSHVVHEGAAWIEVVPGEGADLPLVPEVGERNLQGAGEEHRVRSACGYPKGGSLAGLRFAVHSTSGGSGGVFGTA